MKVISSLLLACSALAVSAAPAGDWKLHPTFDSNVQQVIDTPNKTYFRALGQVVYTTGTSEPFHNPYPFLFAYDKEADELEGLTRRNMLSENIVYFMDYNADKEYLFLAYDNGDIDFLYDNGKKYNLPVLKSMTFPSGKGINAVGFDDANGRVWVATDFGLMAIDQNKYEVALSLQLPYKVTAICRVGDKVIFSDGTSVYSIDANSKYPTTQSVSKLNGPSDITVLKPLDGGKFAIIAGNQLYTSSLTESGISTPVPVSTTQYTTMQANRDGYFLRASTAIGQLDRNGQITNNLSLSGDDASSISGSWDFKNFWFAKNRAGLYGKRYADGSWSTTHEAMMPNSPGVFRATHMLYDNHYGMLVIDHGYTRVFSCSSVNHPSHLSAYKDGGWDRYAFCYTNPSLTDGHTLPLGIAVDPDNPKYLYSGSWRNGMVRYNTEDPTDLVRFSNSNDEHPNIGTVYKILPDKNSIWAMTVGYPQFDSQGNLWIATPHIWTDEDPRKDEMIMVWPADARRRGDMTGWIGIDTPNWRSTWGAMFHVLKHANNKGIVLGDSGYYGDPILVYDSGSDVTDKSDDKMVLLGDIVDADGGSVDHHYIYKFWEDPQTGLVWAMGDAGLFTFNPRSVFTDSTRVNRIKVSRNDGTNLADYLLYGIPVYGMTADASGKKYFATGGGIVVTSSDGREIYAQYTEDNSYLPSNVVYSVEFNPSNNSLMVSTANGLCEFFPSGSTVSADKTDSVKIYPNPVRPDYYGWINIEGLGDAALVKIVDASGSLVKELGAASGGTAQWDGTNMDLKRVRSGVYYVLTSSTSSDSNSVKAGKILVVN